MNDYLTKAKQLRRLDEYLEKKIKEIPNVDKLLVIKGVELSTVIGFMAEVGDSGCFTAPSRYRNLQGLK